MFIVAIFVRWRARWNPTITEANHFGHKLTPKGLSCTFATIQATLWGLPNDMRQFAVAALVIIRPEQTKNAEYRGNVSPKTLQLISTALEYKD